MAAGCVTVSAESGFLVVRPSRLHALALKPPPRRAGDKMSLPHWLPKRHPDMLE